MGWTMPFEVTAGINCYLHKEEVLSQYVFGESICHRESFEIEWSFEAVYPGFPIGFWKLLRRRHSRLSMDWRRRPVGHTCSGRTFGTG